MDQPSNYSFSLDEVKRYKNLVKRKLKTIKKYVHKCLKLIDEASDWKKEQHEAALLQAHLYLLKGKEKEVFLPDWEKDGKRVKLILDGKLKPHEEVALRFKRCKKHKLGLEPLKRELSKANQELAKYQEALAALEFIEEEEGLKRIAAEYQLPKPQDLAAHQKKELAPSKPYFEFLSQTGVPIWVGKSAKNNDLLTFKCAHGNDYWIHTVDYAGSHIVIHSSKKVDDETLHDAIQLALKFSKAKKSGSAEVCISQRKYVSKIGSAAGKVQVGKKKIIFAKLDEERLSKLRQVKPASS